MTLSQYATLVSFYKQFIASSLDSVRLSAEILSAKKQLDCAIISESSECEGLKNYISELQKLYYNE